MAEVTRDIVKGTRIRAQWLETRPVSLAGFQMKLEATTREVIGTVRHIRTDNPHMPTNYRLFVEPDVPGEGEVFCETCLVFETIIKPEHVVEVF